MNADFYTPQTIFHKDISVEDMPKILNEDFVSKNCDYCSNSYLTKFVSDGVNNWVFLNEEDKIFPLVFDTVIIGGGHNFFGTEWQYSFHLKEEYIKLPWDTIFAPDVETLKYRAIKKISHGIKDIKKIEEENNAILSRIEKIKNL